MTPIAIRSETLLIEEATLRILDGALRMPPHRIASNAQAVVNEQSLSHLDWRWGNHSELHPGGRWLLQLRCIKEGCNTSDKSAGTTRSVCKKTLRPFRISNNHEHRFFDGWRIIYIAQLAPAILQERFTEPIHTSRIAVHIAPNRN